jgi:hypothetical protein
LLTLLKQARAFGVGIVLATQNPVDLDYKGLANAGTWFIGRLQTERDRARVMDGLEGAGATGNTSFNRQAMEQTLAGLESRLFLMNNVHDEQPEVLQTRWTLSYLRGPLTRDQIRILMADRKSGTKASASSAVGASVTGPEQRSETTRQRPLLPPEIPQSFIPLRNVTSPGNSLLYQPMLLGCAKVYFADAKAKISAERGVSLLAEFADSAVSIDWQRAMIIGVSESDLESRPPADGSYASLPTAAPRAKSFEGWKKALSEHLYRTQVLELFRSPSLGQVSAPDESEREFRVRLQQAAREERDLRVDGLRKKYASKLAVLQDRIRRAQQAVERETQQAEQQKVQTMISLGATVLGAFLGRKAVSSATLGRATTAARGVGRAMKESQDIVRAGQTVEVYQQQLADLESDLQAEIDGLETSSDPLVEKLETVLVKPKKTDISVTLLTLVWVPFWQDANGTLTPASAFPLTFSR